MITSQFGPESKSLTVSCSSYRTSRYQFSRLFRPNEISDEDYNEFYKALTKDYQEPLAKTHFNAEGEVSFKALLFVPKAQPSDSFNRYGTVTDNIKVN